MSSNDLIVTPDNDSSIGFRRKRKRRHDESEGISAEIIDEAEVMNQLNSLNTNARNVLMDGSRFRINTLTFLAQQASVAKKILNTISDVEHQFSDTDRIRFNLVESMDFLRMMTDLYDNKFIITIDEEPI